MIFQEIAEGHLPHLSFLSSLGMAQALRLSPGLPSLFWATEYFPHHPPRPAPPTRGSPHWAGLSPAKRNTLRGGRFVTDEKVKKFLEQRFSLLRERRPWSTCGQVSCGCFGSPGRLLLLLFIQHRGSALNRCLGWHGSLRFVNRPITKQWSYYIRSEELVAANKSCTLRLQSYNYPKF